MERILWVVGCIAVWALLVFLMYRGGRAAPGARQTGSVSCRRCRRISVSG